MSELSEWKAKRKRLKIRYLPYLPRKGVPEGFVLVHNHVVRSLTYGWNGFRWWQQLPDDALEECPCEWCGFAKEFGAPHYRVKRAR